MLPVKVRGTAYIWGSASVLANITFPQPLVLHIHNDVLGEDVMLSTAATGEPPAELGTISAGQALSIPLQDVTGVVATCDLQSRVRCTLTHD
jgi:hypothetical protein